MPTGLDFTTTHTPPGPAGSEFVNEIDSSLGTSWASHFDETQMATSTAPGATPATAVAPVNHDISIGQRMISASAGNILTGLLGELETLIGKVLEMHDITNIFRSHPSRCRTSPFTITITDGEHYTIYHTYNPVFKKSPCEYWNYLVLS